MFALLGAEWRPEFTFDIRNGKSFQVFLIKNCFQTFFAHETFLVRDFRWIFFVFALLFKFFICRWGRRASGWGEKEFFWYNWRNMQKMKKNAKNEEKYKSEESAKKNRCRRSKRLFRGCCYPCIFPVWFKLGFMVFSEDTLILLKFLTNRLVITGKTTSEEGIRELRESTTLP